jgi:hypothetical protein
VLSPESIGLICRGHRAVALENLALRQQLATLTRTVKRAVLRTPTVLDPCGCQYLIAGFAG